MAYTVSEIIDLRIYPIKSCRGISLQSAKLTRQGLELDRRWMVSLFDRNAKGAYEVRFTDQLTMNALVRR